MKLVKQTDEYIVYLKRSGRYGVKNTDREWINGVSKIRILLAEGLVETTLPPEPEADADEVVDDAGGPLTMTSRPLKKMSPRITPQIPAIQKRKSQS